MTAKLTPALVPAKKSDFPRFADGNTIKTRREFQNRGQHYIYVSSLD